MNGSSLLIDTPALAVDQYHPPHPQDQSLDLFLFF